MTNPCQQGERLITLELILEQMAGTLEEQKALGSKTYEVLAVISGQSEQIKMLVIDTVKLKGDMEEAFKSIRRIDLRHEYEQGERDDRKVVATFVEKAFVPVLLGLCFFVWLSDKFNWFVKIAQLWHEFNG